jgi:hypothetical protein
MLQVNDQNHSPKLCIFTQHYPKSSFERLVLLEHPTNTTTS